MQLQARYDLEYFPVEGYRNHCWVVRDPLTRQCYHLGEEEYFLLTELNRFTSLEKLRQQFEKQFFPRLLPVRELKTLVSDWLMKHLIIGDPLVVARWKQELGIVEEDQKSVWKAWLKNPLVIRFRGWNPQAVLNELVSWFRWVYSLPVLVGLLLIYLTAVGIAIQNLPDILWESSQLPRLFGVEHWLIVILLIGMTKVFHELGHALTCHHFGGRCHEMGVMILAGMPCLYCNVSDAWTFRRRYERVLVSLAGIAVDLLVASFAIFLWSVTSPGLLHSVCLLLALVCSLNSLFLNGNPLMRYDGYYILSDLTGQANLRSESQKQARSLLWRGVMGSREAGDEQPVAVWQVVYGTAAGIYMWLVVSLILAMAYHWFKTWGGENLVVAAGTGLVLSLAIGISRRWIRESKKEYQSRGKKKSRVRWGLATCFLGLLLLVLIPFPRRVPALAGVLQREGLQPVVCLEEGVLKEILPQARALRAGQTLFALENVELQQQLRELQSGGEVLEARELAIQRKRTQLADSTESLVLIAEQKKSWEDQHRRLVQRDADLMYVAQTDGRFYPNPVRPRAAADQIVEQVEARHLTEENLGRLLKTGEVLGEFSNQKSYRVLVAVEEHWAKKLSSGGEAIVFVPEAGGRGLRGRLVDLSPASFRVSEQEVMSDSAASQVLSRLLSEKFGQEQMSVVTGWVEIEDAAEADWNLYQGCQVRLNVEKASLATRVVEFLQRNWKL